MRRPTPLVAAQLVAAPLLLAAACVGLPGEPQARVDRVILYRETLTVLMSDGALCVSDRPGRATAWSGRLEGCPHPLAVEVRALPAGPREVLAPGRAPGSTLESARVIVAGEGWG